MFYYQSLKKILVPTLFLFNRATSVSAAVPTKRALAAAWAGLPVLVAQLPWQEISLSLHNLESPPGALPAQPKPGWAFTLLPSHSGQGKGLGTTQSYSGDQGSICTLWIMTFFPLSCLQSCVLPFPQLCSSQWITSFMHRLLPCSFLSTSQRGRHWSVFSQAKEGPAPQSPPASCVWEHIIPSCCAFKA